MLNLLCLQGYPEPRVYMESQHWFTSPGKDIDRDSKHTHIGACVPHGQTVSGEHLQHVKSLHVSK